MNDEYKELLSPEVRERAYRETVANTKERIVKSFKLRVNHKGKWSLEKLTNPIDDPKGYKSKYPATDDPQGQDRGQAMDVELVTDPSADTTPAPTEFATSAPPSQPSTSRASTFSEAADRFLANLSKEVAPSATKPRSRTVSPEKTKSPAKEKSPEKTKPRKKTPPPSSDSEDKTDSSREDWPPETAEEKLRRELKAIEYEKKQAEKKKKRAEDRKKRSQERSKSKSREKTPGKDKKKASRKGSGKGSKKGGYSANIPSDDEVMDVTPVGQQKLPAQRPQAAKSEPQRRIRDVVNTEVTCTWSRLVQLSLNKIYLPFRENVRLNGLGKFSKSPRPLTPRR